MMNQDSNPITTNNHPTLATVCGQCGVEERKLLHNVRVRGNFRRLCTTCVLRLHPQCFCPACFGVYHRTPPDDAVVCYKCYSSSHPSCVPPPPASSIASSRGPTPCATCLNPNALVLNLNRLENGSRNGGRAIDKNGATLLLAAAKIASFSMDKAELAAALEAVRRGKEAAYTKKRAREALDHVVHLMVKEKRIAVENSKKVVNANNSAVALPVPVPVPVPVSVPMPVPLAAVDAGAVNSKVDSSNEVIEAMNAVELKEKERLMRGLPVGTFVSEARGNAAAVMEVDVVNGKDSGVKSVAENGSGKIDHSVKAVEGEETGNDQEQTLEKIQDVEENSISNPKALKENTEAGGLQVI